MDKLSRIDKAWGEALVNLGAIVLRLSDPAVTKSARAGALRQSILAVRRSFRRPPRAAVASSTRGDDPAQITAGVGPGLQAAEDSDVSFIQWTIAGQYCSSTRLPMNSPR